MKKLMIIVACAALAGSALGECVGMNARVVVTRSDGSATTNSVAGVKRADGGVVVTVKKEVGAPGVRYVEVYPDWATAKKGETGFWLGARGLMGTFSRDSGVWTSSRNWNSLPYFGMKTPRRTFIAVVEGMRFEYETLMKIVKGNYETRLRWHVGDVDGGAYDDMTAVFYELGKDDDYNRMAKKFREWRLAREPQITGEPKIKTLKERIAERPHLAKLANSVALRQMCASKPFKRPDDARDFTPETEHPVRCVMKFSDVLEHLKKMKAMGMDDLSVCIAGWQTGGYDGRGPSVFPVEDVCGGEGELRKLIKGGQDLGFIMDCQVNYTDCFTVSPHWDNGNIACKGPTGKIERNGAWCGGIAHNLCLKHVWESGFVESNSRRTRDLGFFGSHYVDVYTAVFPYRCCDKNHAANRDEQMRYQVKHAKLCRELFGGFSSECCFDHLIGLVDYINYATAAMRGRRQAIAKGHDPIVEKFVPFWELAFHDYVLANPDKITQEVLGQKENLILIEFGGRPIFYHFNDKNIPAIKTAYEQFKKLRHLQVEEMVEHKELKPGVVRVTYGNGDKVYVNHTASAAEVDGVSIPATDWKLVK